MEFHIDIDPTSLVTRIISVREQLSAEWAEDLDTLAVANNMILDSYHDKSRNARKIEEWSEVDLGSGTEAIDMSCAREKVVFDRNAQFMLQNSNAFNDLSSSPLRQGNFDLLMLLSTQESVHRVLRNYKDTGREHEATFEWFRDFYVERVASFFDGNQEGGRSDDFLEELLLTPPSVKNDGGKVALIDPLHIAEDVIRIRGAVAMEWKEIAANCQSDHTSVRRQLLGKRMEKWGHRPEFPVLVTSQALKEEINVFQ